MAQRDERPKRKTAPGSKQVISGADSVAQLEARCRALEAECETLRAELAQAQGRVAGLERARNEVVDRIDWIVDSLNGLKQADE